jgi:hypothetical protein
MAGESCCRSRASGLAGAALVLFAAGLAGAIFAGAFFAAGFFAGTGMPGMSCAE